MSFGATLEQLFYGSGRDGYGILAASPGAEPFRAAAASLCESFGTPSGGDPIEPFLLCRRDGDGILFARGVQGRNDPQGRRTVFVHVLIAAREPLDSARVDPFALARCGIFRETLPDGTPGAIDLDLSSLDKIKPVSSPSLPHPVVIQSSRPIAEKLIRATFGDCAWAHSWATWSWRFLDGFAVQALPPRTPVPDFIAVYDNMGKRLRASSVPLPSSVPQLLRESVQPNLPSGPSAPPPRKSTKLLAASLLLNVVLAIVCAWAFLKPQEKGTSPVAEKPIVDNTAQELAEILASSYPGWKTGSLDAFLEPTSAKSWEQSKVTGQSAVYQFLAKTYALAIQSAQSIPPPYSKKDP